MIAWKVGRGKTYPPSSFYAHPHPERRPNPTMHRPDRDGPHRAQFEVNRKIILATQDICAICGKPVDKTLKSPNPMSASVDHIIPVSKGGHPSDLSNLQLAHRACNRAKGTHLVPPKKIEDDQPNRMLPHSHDWKRA